ncbi:hypothetical protein ILYODFUR_029003 [Ilyodon furcidens]|uniref:Uncharacterized protein n=1 Tax=Ilyodon furcidens TaxID=33524 RepID=A0ABV0T2T7_9TELE
MTNTPSHMEQDPSQSKLRDLTFQFEHEAKENSASNQRRMTSKTDVDEGPRKVSQKSDSHDEESPRPDAPRCKTNFPAKCDSTLPGYRRPLGHRGRWTVSFHK